MRTCCNAWPTSNRFHEKIRLPALCGCDVAIGDDLRHYIRCRTLWKFVGHAALKIPWFRHACTTYGLPLCPLQVGAERCIHARMLVRAINHVSAFVTATAYQTYCKLKFADVSDVCAAIRAGNRSRVHHIVAAAAIATARDVSLVAPSIRKSTCDSHLRQKLSFPSMSLKCNDPHLTNESNSSLSSSSSTSDDDSSSCSSSWYDSPSPPRVLRRKRAGSVAAIVCASSVVTAAEAHCAWRASPSSYRSHTSAHGASICAAVAMGAPTPLSNHLTFRLANFCAYQRTDCRCSYSCTCSSDTEYPCEGLCSKASEEPRVLLDLPVETCPMTFSGGSSVVHVCPCLCRPFCFACRLITAFSSAASHSTGR